jgi:hypothetical protein
MGIVDADERAELEGLGQIIDPSRRTAGVHDDELGIVVSEDVF